jgi:hypothetical protein
MTDEAKALTKRTAVTAGVVLLVLLEFRALLPWVLLAVVGWWIWRAVSLGLASKIVKVLDFSFADAFASRQQD